MVNNPPANAGDTGSVPELGRSSGDRNRLTDTENKLMVTKRERGWERDKLGLADRNYYTHTYTHAHTHTRFYCIAQGK